MEPLPSSVREQPARTSLRVVAIGGGTGLSTLLKGLKKFVILLANVRILAF